MFHHIARARTGQLLFDTWAEGLVLWHTVLRVAPAPIALCVMPNHLHLLTVGPMSQRLGWALSGYARAWNVRHGSSGQLFQRSPAPAEVERSKRRRVHRYVVLNPCRAGLTDDPLAWPLATFIDEVGLADAPVRRKMDDVFGHHGYVVADDRVRVRQLPVAGGSELRAHRLVAAVSHAARVPVWDVVECSGRARVLAVRSARVLNGWGVRRTARELGIARSTVGEVAVVRDRGVDVVAKLAESTSIDGLADYVLRRAIGRSVYRNLRSPPHPRDGSGVR